MRFTLEREYMPGAGYPDDSDAVSEERERWVRETSTRDRVYETAVQLYEPATVETVADRARCSEGAAREHLEWFSERGIVEPIEGRPKRYRRNDAYFEWARANELRRERTDAELESRLEDLVADERAYRERYGVDAPQQVDALEVADYDSIETVWEDVGEWKTIRREIRILERARRDRDVFGGAGIVG